MSRKGVFVLVAVIGLCVAPRPAQAALIDIGIFSFDTFIPGPDGTNVLVVGNFTGDPAAGGFALPPDFPVVTSLILGSPVVSWTTAGGSASYDFGGIDFGPGFLPFDFAVQFPDITELTSATFTAVLTTTLFESSDGRVFEASSPLVTATLLNPSGVLAPGDALVLSVDANELTATVPEPATLILLASGLATSVVARKRRLTGAIDSRR